MHTAASNNAQQERSIKLRKPAWAILTSQEPRFEERAMEAACRPEQPHGMPGAGRRKKSRFSREA